MFPARTLWGKVLEASRNAVVQETALKNADEVLPHLTKLDEMLNKYARELSSAQSAEISAEMKKTIMACRMAFDLCQACQKSEEAGAVEKAALLETSLGNIAKTLQDLFEWPPMLKDMMDVCFQDGRLHVENGSTKLGDIEISSAISFFQTLELEGMFFLVCHEFGSRVSQSLVIVVSLSFEYNVGVKAS